MNQSFRIISIQNNVVAGHGTSYIDAENESANEDETIDIDDSKYNQNMSDITNIQMRLDNIQVCVQATKPTQSPSLSKESFLHQTFQLKFISQQQMSAMQKTSVSQPKDEEQKVPKLKLKLTQPFQNPVESEQSSTESDSDSDNENEDEENATHEQSNMSNEIGTNDTELQLQQQQLSQLPEQQLQQQYPYDGSSCLMDTSNITTNHEENLNESVSSAKNTSTDSDDKSINVEDNGRIPDNLLAVPAQPLPEQDEPGDQLQSLAEPQEPNLDATQTDLAGDINSMTNVGVSLNLFMRKVHCLRFKSSN